MWQRGWGWRGPTPEYPDRVLIESDTRHKIQETMSGAGVTRQGPADKERNTDF